MECTRCHREQSEDGFELTRRGHLSKRCRSCMEYVRQPTTCKRCLKAFPLEDFRFGAHGKRITYCPRCADIRLNSQRVLLKRMRDNNQALAAAGDKQCLRCRSLKRLDEFRTETGVIKNRCATCRAYMRQHREGVRRTWSIEKQAYEASKRMESRKVLRASVLAAYGGHCKCCGEAIQEFLAIDHIHGDGASHRRSLRAKERPYGVKASGFYIWLRDNGYPEGFQCLCHNCNVAKGLYGVCPHRLNPLLLIENRGLEPAVAS